IDPDKDVQIVALGSHTLRTQGLLNGSVDAGVDDPPEDQELVKAGLNVILDLASQKLPAANTGIIVQRKFWTENKDVVQEYVDATVIARSRMAKDKDGSVAVLKKYFKITEDESPTHAYNFFIGGSSPVTPVYPFPAVEQFKDAVARWPRMDALGAYALCRGRGDFADMYVCEIPPGSRTSPQRHLYEAVVYVLSGRGSTTLDAPEGKRSFEWREGSLFALPLNARYQHFNGSGQKPARFAAVTDLPLVFNVFRSESFIFENDATFPERFGDARYNEG